MKALWKKTAWIFATIGGSAVFALGFALFLQPNEMNAGGISGLALIFVELTGLGTVGILSILINLPLFILGGLKIGKRFFVGSLIGMLLSSVLIDVFAALGMTTPEPLLAIVYGAALCGLGIGLVFSAGTSTGGSEIVVRLLKLKWRNVSVGAFCLAFDVAVAVLTGLVFQDVTKILYTGITVFVTSRVLDIVVYRFDYSKVALIITKEHEKVAQVISDNLGRGATYLHGQGTYTGADTKVVLTAIKRQQLAELKDIVIQIDPNAFIIVQEAHQVLGDGFARYTKDSL